MLESHIKQKKKKENGESLIINIMEGRRDKQLSCHDFQFSESYVNLKF